MGKTNPHKRPYKLIAFRIGPPRPDYQPQRKFHFKKAIPFKQFKQELDAKEREDNRDL